MSTKTLFAFFASAMLVGCGSTKNVSNDIATNLPIETSINLSNLSEDKAPVVINPGRFTVERHSVFSCRNQFRA